MVFGSEPMLTDGELRVMVRLMSTEAALLLQLFQDALAVLNVLHLSGEEVV
jgi:hypothetical protein